MFFLVINALGLCRAGPLRRAGPIKKYVKYAEYALFI
jgi:hypothetical protein